VDDEPQLTTGRLLGDLEAGDRAALDGLFLRVYHELSALAHRQRRRWHGDDTLDTTALIHEAYLKLVDQERVVAVDRAHFLAVAARAMRHILINYARDRRTEKRGGAVQRVPLDDRQLAASTGVSPAQADDLMVLNDALRSLEQIDPRQSRVVECRFFGGMTVEEAAEALGISPRTVKRDWAVAQAWLHRRMEELSG
jgi:RNA polymerase sigma factor (TIGR02999 family)